MGRRMTTSVWGTSKRITICLLVAIAAASVAGRAEARPVTAMWDANTDPYTVGYRIYFGTTPGVYGVQVDVGNVTSYRFDLPPLPRLYFVVRAYSASGAIGPPSNEVTLSGTNQAPILYNPGDLVAPPGPITAQLPAHDPEGDPLTFSATGLPDSLSLDPATGVISGYLPSGVYVVTISASDAEQVTRVTFRLTVLGGGCQSAPPTPILQPAVTVANQVQLNWSSPPGTQPLTYTLQAGTGSGRSDIVVAEFPASVTSIAPPAPNGLYFVRVWGRNACGAAVSNEISFRVGPPPPSAPSLRFQRSGGTVTISWTPSSSGSPTSYIIEAGTGSGLSNLAALNTGSLQTAYTFTLPSGRYYVRVRGVNASGAGTSSNEIVINVP
jgi:hypothetical protein